MIVNNDEKIVIDNLENVDTKSFNFSIKNFDDKNINSIELFYQIEITGLNENINYQLWNLTDDEVLELDNYKSEYFILGFEKREVKYSLIVDFLNSNIEDDTNINIKINTKFKNK